MLAWACDLLIAADNAFFADPVLRMGAPGVEYFAHAHELNLRVAREIEDSVRAAGAVPATVAVVSGVPRIGLDDAVRYHPTQEGSPLPISGLVPKIMDEPMKGVEAAVAAKDHAAFVAAFDALTAGCNSCHQAANFGFNVVQRPTSNPFSNQVFAPPPASGPAGPDAR